MRTKETLRLVGWLLTLAFLAVAGTERARAVDAASETDAGREHQVIQPTRPPPRGDAVGERSPLPPSRKAPGAKKRGVHVSQAERDVLNPFLRAHPELADDLGKDPLLVRDAKYLEKHPELAQFLERYPKMGGRIKQDPHAFMQPKKKVSDEKP